MTEHAACQACGRPLPGSPGRPPKPQATLAALVGAVRELDEYELPVTRTDTAAAATDGDRKRLARDLEHHFPGESDPWAKLLEVSRTRPSEDGSHEGHHRDAA